MIGRRNGVLFFSVVYTDSQGRRQRKYQQNSEWTTKKEAKAAADLFLLSTNKSVDKITLDQLYEIYHKDSLNKVKVSTIKAHEQRYRQHISNQLGSIPLKNMTNRDIDKWQVALISKGFKNNYLDAIQQFLRTLINYGLKHEYINRDVFKQDFVKNHSQETIPMDYWTQDEFARFIEKIDSPMFEAFFSVLYMCGLRKGEAIALTVKDISFDDNTITVNKTYDHRNKLTTLPKTINSIRVVSMTENVRSLLYALVNGLSEVQGFSPKTLLFGTCGHHIASATIKRVQERACVQSGVKIIRIHDFRHSHVSLLVSMGFQPFEIAKRIGDTPEMVNNVYAHWFKSSQDEMIRRLNEVEHIRITVKH